MKSIYFYILSLVFVAAFLSACEHDKDSQQSVSGKLISNSNCKSTYSDADSIYMLADVSCAEYSYNNTTKTLSIKHVNAGFNCCPGEIQCNITTMNDTILIRESETAMLCDCSCLYDLNIEVYGIDSKKYVIRFIEPYIGNQEQLIFEVNLDSQNTGSYCVPRSNYPWGN
jgi:hypothetical protein